MEMIQQPMTKRKNLFVVILVITVCCLWSMLALYAIVGGKTEESVYAPQVVYVAPTTPATTSSGPAFYTGSRRSGTLRYHHPAPAVSYTPAPKATMGSTSMRVHQTSNASVHSYGGGGTGGAGNVSFKRRSANNSGGGITYTAIAYRGSIYVPTAHNAVTPVGASSAENVVATKMGAPQRLRMSNGGGGWPVEPGDPAPDPEPPVPAGNIPWVLMALLVAGYICLKKKKYANLTNNFE